MNGSFGITKPRGLELCRGVPTGEGRVPCPSGRLASVLAAAAGSGGASRAPRRPQAASARTRPAAIKTLRARKGREDIDNSEGRAP
jgi:hypothetical protein